jgi:hypothetical protein
MSHKHSSIPGSLPETMSHHVCKSEACASHCVWGGQHLPISPSRVPSKWWEKKTRKLFYNISQQLVSTPLAYNSPGNWGFPCVPNHSWHLLAQFNWLPGRSSDINLAAWQHNLADPETFPRLPGNKFRQTVKH